MSSVAAAADTPEEFAALADDVIDDFMSEAASDVEVFWTTEGHDDVCAEEILTRDLQAHDRVMSRIARLPRRALRCLLGAAGFEAPVSADEDPRGHHRLPCRGSCPVVPQRLGTEAHRRSCARHARGAGARTQSLMGGRPRIGGPASARARSPPCSLCPYADVRGHVVPAPTCSLHAGSSLAWLGNSAA